MILPLIVPAALLGKQSFCLPSSFFVRYFLFVLIGFGYFSVLSI